MPLTMIPVRFPGVPHVRCAFTGRGFGNVSLDLASRSSAPEAWEETIRTRQAIAPALDVPAFAEVHQVHGIRTVFEPEAQHPGRPSVIEADGLASSRPGLALMIKTADCQPILIAHDSGRFIMGIHSGWKGNRQDFPRLAVLNFCEHYDLDPTDLWAMRGPSLGPAAAEFRNFETEWGDGFQRWFDTTKRTMDLWELTRCQLAAAGVRPERILGLDICTFDNAEDFFSYRQFRKNALPDGRQASFIWIA